MKKLFLVFSLVFTVALQAQQDTAWLKLKDFRSVLLSDTLRENSGLTFFNDDLYTINDSGNSSEIFTIDKKNGRVLKTLKTKLKNRDWEAITNDSLHLYVGDFGNNLGTRRDLTVYRIPYADSLQISGISASPFYYPEQRDFSRRNLNHDFDAESMIYLNGKLHIFTKEWASKATTHYIVNPKVTTPQAAQKTERFNTGFAVTDAAYYKGQLYVVGYTKQTAVYLMIFEETAPGIFFQGKSRKFYLGSAASVGQIEGIAVNEEGLYISGEEFRMVGRSPARLYFIPHKVVR